jgi:hypothetical protein
MKGLAGLVGLVIVLGAGYFVYYSYLTRPGGTQVPPQQQIDVIDIRSNLLVIGQAERQYVVAHGAYGTLDQLRQDATPDLGTDLRGYTFDVVPDGARSFQATARPIDSSKSGWPTLAIDETLQVTQR